MERQPPATPGPRPTAPRACPKPRPRGGKRPGAGAPKGNLNALKSGRYSKRLTALRAALDAMPLTADVLVKMTGRHRRKPALSGAEGMEMLAYGLQSGACPRAKRRAEMLLLIARGGSIDDLQDPQLRKRALYAIPIKQSAIAPGVAEDSDVT